MPMELEKVPELLKLLGLSKEQIDKVSEISKNKEKAKGRFVGQIAIDEGMVTQEQVNEALRKQATRKAEAAARDLATIADHGSQAHAKWLDANWGNQGINKATAKPSVSVAAAAASANAAQNIVMLVNEHHPELAADKEVSAGVESAARLSRFLAGDETVRMSEKEAKALADQTWDALRKSADGVTLRSKDGQEIALEDFIRERQAEIDAGIKERVAKLQQEQAAEKDQEEAAIGAQVDASREQLAQAMQRKLAKFGKGQAVDEKGTIEAEIDAVKDEVGAGIRKKLAGVANREDVAAIDAEGEKFTKQSGAAMRRKVSGFDIMAFVDKVPDADAMDIVAKKMPPLPDDGLLPAVPNGDRLSRLSPRHGGASPPEEQDKGRC